MGRGNGDILCCSVAGFEVDVELEQVPSTFIREFECAVDQPTDSLLTSLFTTETKPKSMSNKIQPSNHAVSESAFHVGTDMARVVQRLHSSRCVFERRTAECSNRTLAL